MYSCNCENDLAKLKKNTAKLITGMIQLHEKTQTTLEKTDKTCTGLFNAERSFISGNYANDLSKTRSKLIAFADSYREESDKFKLYFNSTEASYDALHKLGCDFEENKVLTCVGKVAKGPEAELNTLRCDLTNLLDFIKKKRDDALKHLNEIRSVLKSADKLVERFTCDNEINDNGNDSKIRYCDLRRNVSQFFKEFNDNHWPGHICFMKLRFLSDEVSTALSILSEKYSNQNCAH